MELSEQAYITELEHSIVTYRNMGHPFAGVAALLDLPGGAEQAGQLYQNALEKADALRSRPVETVEERVWDMLEELGVHRSMRWAEELAAALVMAVRSPELLVNLECGLYKEMGRGPGGFLNEKQERRTQFGCGAPVGFGWDLSRYSRSHSHSRRRSWGSPPPARPYRRPQRRSRSRRS